MRIEFDAMASTPVVRLTARFSRQFTISAAAAIRPGSNPSKAAVNRGRF